MGEVVTSLHAPLLEGVCLDCVKFAYFLDRVGNAGDINLLTLYTLKRSEQEDVGPTGQPSTQAPSKRGKGSGTCNYGPVSFLPYTFSSLMLAGCESARPRWIFVWKVLRDLVPTIP